MADDATGSDGGQAPQDTGGAGAGELLGAAGGEGQQQQQQQQQAAGEDRGGTGTEGDPGIGSPSLSDWMNSFEGEELGWLQNRGLQGKSADDALKNLVSAQRNAEKRFGVPTDRLLTLPADPTSEGAMDPVWDALGRPEDAGGYELDRGDTDLTAQFADKLGEAFHSAGLSKEQGKAVEKVMEDFFSDQFESETATAAEAQQVALNALKEKWGGEENFNINLAIAKEAVKAAGATADEINALESAMGENGNAKVIEFFNRLGQKRGVETPFIDGDGSLMGLGATTPEAARAKMTEMKSDPDIAKFILENNSENAHVKRYRALAALAAKGMG